MGKKVHFLMHIKVYWTKSGKYSSVPWGVFQH